MFKRLIYIVLILSTTLPTLIAAQPVERFIKVIVAADRPDWTYKIGDKVTFTIAVSKNGNLLNNVRVRYEIGLEKQEPTLKQTITLPTGEEKIDGGTLTTAGFLRCIAIAEVDGKEYRNLGTAAFDPLSINALFDALCI